MKFIKIINAEEEELCKEKSTRTRDSNDLFAYVGDLMLSRH
jgi:hypothetical protein